jgi:HNH endonuclease
MPHRLYPPVAARAHHICEYCRAPEQVSPDRFQVEHIRPRARGGGDDLSNLALSCPRCNRQKSYATHAVDRETGMLVALFNPRRDVWSEHFDVRILAISIVIDGLTANGRVTVDRLAMNDEHICRARMWWAAAGLFPP